MNPGVTPNANGGLDGDGFAADSTPQHGRFSLGVFLGEYVFYEMKLREAFEVVREFTKNLVT